MVLLPENSEEMCLHLLKLLSDVCDLRTHTVQEVGKKVGIPVEQINHLLRRDIMKVKINTFLTIAHASGNQVMVKVEAK